jgi:hypothetical protein
LKPRLRAGSMSALSSADRVEHGDAYTQMTERLRKFSLTRRHPRSQLLSDYLDGDLLSGNRPTLEAHVRDCARCRRLLDSLAKTTDALGSMRAGAPPGLADSVIAAVRAESVPEVGPTERASRRADQPALAVVRPSMRPAVGDRWRDRARAALAYCCRRPQLRVTAPIALVVGIALSFVNQGGMLLDGRIDFRMCVMCATDVLVPFVALNVVLLMIVRAPRRRRR